MSRHNKVSWSFFLMILHVLVVVIFFAGMLPAPALAFASGTIAGHISDNATGDPVANGSVYVYTSGDQRPENRRLPANHYFHLRPGLPDIRLAAVHLGNARAVGQYHLSMLPPSTASAPPWS